MHKFLALLLRFFYGRRPEHREPVDQTGTSAPSHAGVNPVRRDDTGLPDSGSSEVGEDHNSDAQVTETPRHGDGSHMNPISKEQLEMLLAVSAPKLEEVHPMLAERGRQMIMRLGERGMSFGVHMGLRSFALQQALYVQGREPLAVVNDYRAKAGLGPIPESQNKIVTKVKVGFHNFGLALDLVEDGDPQKAGIQWSWASAKNYLVIGEVAQEVGLHWGGWWKAFKDYPHVELTGGLTIAQCNALYQSEGLTSVWSELTKRLEGGV